MKRILKRTAIGAALALVLSSTAMAGEVRSLVDVREDTARQIATMINDPTFEAALREHMSKGRVSLADALREYAQDAGTHAREATTSDLRDLDRESIRLRGLEGRIDSLLGLRVHNVDGKTTPSSLKNFWTATIQRDEVSGKKEVLAYDTQGKEHRYPVSALPDIPMLIVESKSAAAMQAGIALVNEELRSHGLQKSAPAGPSANARDSRNALGDPEELTMLKKIYLTDDEEPNLFRDADVYAVVSGVAPDGKAQIVMKDMPWLDKDKTWYTPNQDLITWRDYSSNYVNVQFFESDAFGEVSANFKDIAMALVGAVGDVSMLVAPAAPEAVLISGITKIATTIMGAIPKSVWTNSDEYIDSFYVIERGGNYGTDEKPLAGARNHALLVLEPYRVKGH